MEYQGIGTRFVAQVVDMIVVAAIFLAVGLLASIPFNGFTATGFHLTGIPALIVIGLTLLLSFLYFAILEAEKGQTLGKMVMGIKVVTAEGDEIEFEESLKRNILRIVDFIGVYLVGAIFILSSDKNQRLGDKVADTVVVEK